MPNTSDGTSFILAAYSDMGDLRYLAFTVLLLLYLVIICANILLVYVIYANRSLHEPQYFLLCSLAVNGLYGSTGLFPSLLFNIASGNYTISRVHCLMQIFCLYTYAIVELTSLAVMGYDRYLSICYPLQYNMIMSPSKVHKLILLTWLFPFAIFSVFFLYCIQLPLCNWVINKVYCDNYSLIKLACVNTTINNIFGIMLIIVCIVFQSLIILYSYIKILSICLKSSRDSSIKALNTCIPHLVTLLNFAAGCAFELIQSRFNMSHVPYMARVILSVYFLIFPPLLNPIIYGVRTQAIKSRLKIMLCEKIGIPVTETQKRIKCNPLN
ncbi:O52D1 protein, partial [Atractosteus spatula]|nr:O52D1 protein [Atractosteus spatula]